MKKYIFTILFVINFSIYSQKIDICVTNFAEQNAKLYSLSGEKLTFIDSVRASQNTFSFQINGEKGFYRVLLEKNKPLNFIVDNEDVEIKTNGNAIADSLKIIKSESNKIYYDFVKLNKDYKTKSELLTLILAQYPKEDDFYQKTKNKLQQIEEEYNYFVNVTSQGNPKSFIAKYVKSAQLPIIDHALQIEQQLDYLKSHSLDNVDFNNAGLINSDLFTNKAIEYLTYYRNPQLPKELLEKEFMIAVDTLLNRAKVNQLVYQHITEYLLDGFKKFGFDKIIDFIIENYVIKDDLCLDKETENSIQKRIDQSKLLGVGTKVPDIIMPDINGKIINLSSIESEKTLLVFYSSQCPQCQTLLPQLNQLQKQRKDLKILAISLDNKEDDWIKFVKDNKLDMLHINDPNGWGGDLAHQFYIYATPTMFLLNGYKEIISKPLNISEIKTYL